MNWHDCCRALRFVKIVKGILTNCFWVCWRLYFKALPLLKSITKVVIFFGIIAKNSVKKT